MVPGIEKLFSKTYILGGSPCSGKSTVAERLSTQFKLQYYKVDDYEKEHLSRCDPKRHPVMFRYSRMGWNEIWVRPVSVQVEEEFEYYRERFEMIVQDLSEYDHRGPIVLEGAAYLPELISEYKADRKRVLYMVPTKAFQIHHYRQRPWINHILKECDNPKQAFENWMMRDHLFGQEILRQAAAYNYETMLIDGEQSLDRQIEQVSSYFGLL